MNGDLLALLLSVLPAPQQRPPKAAKLDIRRAQEEAETLNQLLTQLLQLQQRVRAGALPDDLELALARTPREQLLAGVDVKRSVELGMEPKAVRDRLQPGFTAEIELLEAQRERKDAGPLREASPLLTMVLDLEQDLWREADRRRQRAGIKSPLDSGPLSKRLQPNPSAVDETATPRNPGANAGAESPVASSAAAATGAVPSLPKGGDLRLLGQAHYRAGRFAEALDAWKDLIAPAGTAGLEFEYQRADCRLRTGQIDEAITAWEKLSADNKSTSWGAQAEFALKVARAMQAVRAAQKTTDGGSR